MRLLLLALMFLGLGGYLVLELKLEREETIFSAINDSIVGYRVRPLSRADGFSTNEVSMRAPPVPGANDRCTLRLMIFGDSVVFGNGLRDRDLATSLLERGLEDHLDWSVWVGNASMGGWSPNNVQGYVERFGWFDADMIGFVLNSHDIDQSWVIDPTVEDGAAFDIPRMRLIDHAKSWLVRHVPFDLVAPPATTDPYLPESGAPLAKDVLRALLTEASGVGPTYVFHNRVVGEIGGHDPVSEQAVRERRRAPRLVSLIREHEVVYANLGEKMAATAGAYRDHIHLSATGQKIMADEMMAAMMASASKIIEARLAACSKPRTPTG